MPTLIIKIATIEEMKEKFGWNDELKAHQNISILGEKLLISTLRDNGLDFDFTIAREEKGKPYFLYNNKVHFSISDTKNYIAVAIHDSRIGIDIEYLRKGKQQLAERFFHKNEIIYLNNVLYTTHHILNATYDKAFTQLWTIKEAYVKMTGTGIAGNFSTIDLSPQEFSLTQNYQKNNALIKSYRDLKTDLFVSVCIKND